MIRSNSLRDAFGCGCLLLMLGHGAVADTRLSIRGVILGPPPCIINGGNTLNVPFGDSVMTTQVDGVNYLKQVPFILTCGPQPSNAMTLKLSGIGAGFDSTVLSTSKADLGVMLLLNGSSWPLNQSENFTYPTLPRMEAVLVKKAGSTLTGGAFSATATIVVALQ